MGKIWSSPDARRISGSHPLAADETFLRGIDAGCKALGLRAHQQEAYKDELVEFATSWRLNYLAGQRDERERWREILASPAASLHREAAIHLASNTDLTATEAVEALALVAGSGRPN